MLRGTAAITAAIVSRSLSAGICTISFIALRLPVVPWGPIVARVLLARLMPPRQLPDGDVFGARYFGVASPRMKRSV
ncbi:MAG: hypothetical protein OHK0015_20580 [Chloroflexi bacterium OHK40]